MLFVCTVYTENVNNLFNLRTRSSNVSLFCKKILTKTYHFTSKCYLTSQLHRLYETTVALQGKQPLFQQNKVKQNVSVHSIGFYVLIDRQTRQNITMYAIVMCCIVWTIQCIKLQSPNITYINLINRSNLVFVMLQFKEPIYEYYLYYNVREYTIFK